ncbi:hypothetical protein sscle_02g017150 [Sclerotinia sclerotiorum 1980 UF-70]|uniref:Uncharacterized protein n=1 Tax=Sclerotinia sclerotiorum (strain ATCC 18683 / 1980 / Ss-1) TaxID=665079 RepID=A0A1D9PW56_SCLS1|nr:hypothetical protein sscle_02g017150 [Sclerotinia sclerotiorum 1980 UF-70]
MRFLSDSYSSHIDLTSPSKLEPHLEVIPHVTPPLQTHTSPSIYIIPTSKMCEYTRNYYIYTSCVDPGAHYFSTSIDGSKDRQCAKGPHERYIVVPGHCPLCS